MSDALNNVDAAINGTLSANDTASNDGANQNTQQTEQGNAADSQTQNSTGATGNNTAAGADNRASGGGNNSRQQSRQQSSQAAQASTNGARNPGDLVDAQGNVIARAGAERRHYENWQTERRAHATTYQQMQQLTAELGGYKQAAQMSQQLGLQPDQTVTALQLFANYIKNPVETIKYILTEAKAAGHNVDNIGVGGTLDMAALGRVIDQRLAPLTEQHQQMQLAQQAAREAEQVWGGFIDRFPDAPLHEQAMVTIMQRDPSLDLTAAYFMLKSWAQEHGLDFGKPLAEQYAARLQQNGGNNTDTRTATQQRGGLPNGRGGNTATTMVNMQPGGIASENMSSSDIVKEALREAGINLQ